MRRIGMIRKGNSTENRLVPILIYARTTMVLPPRSGISNERGHGVSQPAMPALRSRGHPTAADVDARSGVTPAVQKGNQVGSRVSDLPLWGPEHKETGWSTRRPTVHRGAARTCKHQRRLRSLSFGGTVLSHCSLLLATSRGARKGKSSASGPLSVRSR